MKRFVRLAVVCLGLLLFAEHPMAIPPAPGNPILVVTSAANPFTTYYAEILRTEGLNAFAVADIGDVIAGAVTLSDYDVVILGEMPLQPSDATRFGNFVNAGGNLIAMRPDKDLYALLGLTDQASTRSNAYVLFNTSSGPGAGLVGEPIQYHGDADLVTASGATTIATLYSNATTATANPAVTMRSVGSSGGQAAAFMFDLARSVVYMRQGNPAWAGQDRDGVAPIRSSDLFFGASASDPQPDWVNLNKVQIPQADEQQRLLANLILNLNNDKKPLPRFWYFPRGKKAVVVMTGDDHGNGGTGPRFEQYKTFSPLNCSADNWECVRGSSYIYSEPGKLSNAEVVAYSAQGFEIFLHLNNNCASLDAQALGTAFTDQIAALYADYPGMPQGVTHRAHCVAWSDYTTLPQVELTKGIRLDTNYYYWPPDWVANRPGMFTGSGMPMRFAKADGTMIDVFQAPTQMTDESNQLYPLTVDTLLDKAVGPEGFFGAFTANMHTDFNSVTDPKQSMTGSNAIVASAQARGVPVVSARQMLAWLDGRNASAFSGIAWNAITHTLSFSISVGAGANGLQTMLPIRAGSLALTGLTRAGAPVSYAPDTIKGVDYALFTAAAGSYQATYVPDTTPPVISDVLATVTSLSTAIITWTTNEASTSHVDFGTSISALQSGPSSSELVTSHSLSLTGLAANTQYFYQVKSADAVSPLPNVAVSSVGNFTTPSAAFKDTTVADFSAGSPGGSTKVELIDDGAVILGPGVSTDFDGPGLPAGWSSCLWNGNDCLVSGGATVANGVLTVDGARVNTDAFYSPGHSLEFRATFTGDPFQHAGFGTTFAAAPWAQFSTGEGGCPTPAPPCAGTDLWVKSHNGTTELKEKIPGSWLNAPHRYRIDWNPTNIAYSIDGTVVANHPVQIATQMRPIAASDYFTSFPGTITVDWLRMNPPYVSNGTFDSRIFDAGSATNWGNVAWTAGTPPGTGLTVSVRKGDTPIPDGTWSGFAQVLSGMTIGGTSRYIQYRAQLTTTNPQLTPVISELLIGYGVGGPLADTLPPRIANVAHTVTSFPGSSEAIITWTTDKFASSQVLFGTTPGALTGSISDPALVASHSMTLRGLLANTTYYYRVRSVDDQNNTATSPSPPTTASFTTPTAPPALFVDTTVTNFSAGTGTATYVSQTTDGEVTLAPVIGVEFGGTALPAGWLGQSWSAGGAATVAGGLLTVDGARAGLDPTAGFGTGRSIEFVATFGAEAFQHVGFTSSFNVDFPWALFSTNNTTETLFARTRDSSIQVDTPIPGGPWIGVPHRYRIDWIGTTVTYSIDGLVKATQTNANLGSSLRPIVSDANPGGGSLSVDWLRMTPYPASGTFASRVFDAGVPTAWGTISWTADAPANTSLAITVRTGNTPTPDGTWIETPISSSGSAIAATSRYIQYLAALGSTDITVTPALQSVTIGFSGGQPSNIAPIANNDSYATDEDTPITVAPPGLLRNDTDANGDALNATLVSNVTAAQGSVALQANGSFTYTPAAQFHGTASFTYKARDVLATGSLESNAATVTISVRPKAIITVGGSFVYDGNPHDAITTATGIDGAPVSGSFSVTYTPGGANAPVNAGTYGVVAVFTSSDPNYVSSSATGTVVIAPALPTVIVTGGSFTFDGTSHPATAVATGIGGMSIIGTFSITYNPGGSSAPVNAGTYTATATFTSSDPNYRQASDTGSISIAKATPTIAWNNPADITYGTALGATQLNATATVPGTFAYSPAAGTVLSAGNGQTLSVTFTPTDATNYNQVAKSVVINVLKATPIITWTNPADITYGTALSATQLNATASVAGSFVYAPAAGSVLNASNDQSLSVTFTPTDAANYTTATKSVAISVLKATPVITWNNPADITYGTALSGAQLNATASVPGGFVYSPASGTVLNTGNGQTLSVTFTPTDTANYNGTSKSVLINVSKANQTISFGPLVNKTYGDAPFSVTATASSGLAVSFSIVSGPATISGSTVTIIGAGTVVVRASQAGNTNYNAATNVDQSFTVSKATPTITWTNPADITYGTALSGTQLNATASVAGTFVYSPLSGTVLNAGNGQSLSVTFTPTDTANYNNATTSVAINVLKANQTITFGTLAGKTYGDAPFSVTATASSSLAVTFSIVSGPATIAGSTVTITGVGTVVVRASQAGNTNYNAASNVDQSFTVSKATPTVTWANPADITYGTALSGTQLNATASVAGTFAYTPASGTVLNAGTGRTLSVTFTPTDAANYNTATKSVSINVLKATPTITWGNPADIVSGTPLSSTQLNASASVPGSFVYAPAAGTVLSAGNGQTLSTTFTPTDTTNYTTATKSVLINVSSQAATTTSTPTSSLNPSTFGQSVTLTATVTPSAATGTVQFFDGATSLGTASLSGGSASLTTTAINAGTRSITAKYLGTSSYAASTSATLTQTVNQATGTASLAVTGLTPQYSDNDTFTASF
ncbi:MAG TPA: Ig-like domain repeat protein, partial [Vicinamibacterales bacterium]|nr:Ig-like domain repeat protein [Vicinamibacterales bacterium]